MPPCAICGRHTDRVVPDEAEMVTAYSWGEAPCWDSQERHYFGYPPAGHPEGQAVAGSPACPYHDYCLADGTPVIFWGPGESLVRLPRGVIH